MFYDTAEWRLARRRALHDAGYKCQRCGAQLQWRSKETHVHHRKALKRAPGLRSEPLNLMALCRTCHRIVENEERRPRYSVDVDGNATHRDHPWYQGGVSGNKAT